MNSQTTIDTAKNYILCTKHHGYTNKIRKLMEDGKSRTIGEIAKALPEIPRYKLHSLLGFKGITCNRVGLWTYIKRD